MVIGNIHSVQTLGTLDGPGVRFVLFMQGCPLRCSCCHNPDTWDFGKGTQTTAEAVFAKVMRYKNYFGHEGGLTVSGGEAIMQPEFVRELFVMCRQNGIHTCLDTSGCALDDRVRALLNVTDLVMLDIKYTNEKDYKKYVKGSLETTIHFLEYLEENKIDTWIRQVIISGINDGEDNLQRLCELTEPFSCIKKIEFLAFRTMCVTKYEELGIEFPFGNIADTTPSQIDEINNKFLLFKSKHDKKETK